MHGLDVQTPQFLANTRLWPFAVSQGGAAQARVPPNNGSQDDAPRAARA